MKVAGIDFSSFAIDVVKVDLDDQVPPEWTRFDLTGQDAFDRTRSLSSVVPSRTSVWWDDVLAVGIEHPAGKFGVGPMLRVQGAVLQMLPTTVMVEPWPPKKWRGAVGLSGNATKQDIYQHVMKLEIRGRDSATTSTLITHWPFDACDAYCIALATRAAIETEAAA